MMTITVQDGDKKRKITWDNGALSGDGFAVDLVRLKARSMEGYLVGPPTGPWTDTEHLKDPLSTIFVVGELFEIISVDNPPKLPKVPEGAIL